MRSIMLSLVCVLCLTSETFAVGWQNGQSPDGTQCVSSTATVGGTWYRIRLDGGILRRSSGDSTFRLVRLGDIPEPARAEIAAQYDRFVPVTEQRYSQSALQQYQDSSQRSTTTTTTDSRAYDRSDRSSRSDHSQRTRTSTDTRDRHDWHDQRDQSDRSDHRRYDQQYRDRDIRYRAYTEGANSPSVVMANNYLDNSRMSVDVHPVSEVATMAAFAENRLLIAELIAARREQSQRQEASVTQTVTVNCGCGSGCKPACQQQTVTLSARCWRCGTYFVDGENRRWQRISGPAMKHSPSQLQGTLGRDAQGRVTFTTSWSGQTVVFVDP